MGTVTAPRKDEPSGLDPLAFPDAQTVNDALKPLGSSPASPLGRSPASLIVEPESLLPFPPAFLPIDANLAGDPDFEAGSIETTAKQFQFWQMESLADQAADLLDRCATERAAYDALRSKWAKLILDVVEFEKTEQIHELELKAALGALTRTKARRKGAEQVKIVGCHLHTRYQQVAMLDEETRGCEFPVIP